jgi:hypothetical protein
MLLVLVQKRVENLKVLIKILWLFFEKKNKKEKIKSIVISD